MGSSYYTKKKINSKITTLLVVALSLGMPSIYNNQLMDYLIQAIIFASIFSLLAHTLLTDWRALVSSIFTFMFINRAVLTFQYEMHSNFWLPMMVSLLIFITACYVIDRMISRNLPTPNIFHTSPRLFLG